MRNSRPLLAASAAVLAATVFAGAAWAQSAATPGIPTTSTVLGAKYVNIDGFIYGGMLPIGADKNLDAMRVLIKAADSLGQLRDNQYGANPTFGYYLVIGDTSLAMRVDADGTWNGAKAHVVIGWDYRIPGVRLDVTSADGKNRAITVAAGGLAWDEKTPGIFGGQATTSVSDRLVVPYLMPTAVAVLGRDAAPTIKLSKNGARSMLTIPVPKLGPGINLEATLDAEGHPVHTSIAYNGHTYTGDFSDFLSDRMDFMVMFSHQVSLKVDGKEMANLELNWHQADPYLVFPVPKEVATK
jgi:hypothetical protein